MNRTGLILLVTIVFLLILTACAPSEAQIQKAISQTQTAQPIPPQAPTQTPTNTIIPADTPTPTPDLRVIDLDPETFLLDVDDLPVEGKYYLPRKSWYSPHRNSEIVSALGAEEGRKYLEETGRVDGWWVIYKRGTKTVNMPEEVNDNPVMSKTTHGAKVILEKYSTCAEAAMDKNDFIELSGNAHIGDDSRWCVLKEMQPNGKNKVWLRLEFIYRNYYHGISGYGWESEVTPEFFEGVANALLDKLKAAPLSDTVTYSP